MSREEYRKIQEAVVRELDARLDADDDEVLECIEEYVLKMGHATYLSVEEKKEIIQRIFYSIRKLDVLQELLEDREITEIMVNGPDQIFIEKNGRIESYPKTFISE